MLTGVGYIASECGAITGIAWFSYVSKHWKDYMLILLVFQLIFSFATLYLPESPVFLYAKGRVQESEDVMLWIAKQNGKDIKTFGFSKLAH